MPKPGHTRITRSKQRDSRALSPHRAKRIIIDVFDALLPNECAASRDRLFGRLRNLDPSVNALVEELLPLDHSAETPEDIEKFAQFYQASSFLSKYPFKGNSDICRDAAIVKFRAAEQQCLATNNMLNHYRVSDVASVYAPYLTSARKIISKILKDLDLTYVYNEARHGTGVSNNPYVKRSSLETTAYFKHLDQVTCTREAYNHVISCMTVNDTYARLLCEMQGFDDHSSLLNRYRAARSHIGIVDGNRVTFVPKNYKTDRAIAIEPSGNLMVQLGLGALIRKRLRSWGVDLNDQKKNQKMALLGSLAGSTTELGRLCTLDLSMASDTISKELIRYLLPTDWFEVLDAVRSKCGTLRGDTFEYEKFSSMGNGFTFELESLIFFALTLAVMRSKGVRDHRPLLTQFGDDQVLPEHALSLTVGLFRFCGFTTNADKSFSTGNFRESCGADYVNGINVRPLLLRRELKTINDVYFLANRLLIKAIETSRPFYMTAWNAVVKHLRKNEILPIPFIPLVKSHFGADISASDHESGLMLPLSEAVKFNSVRYESRSRRPSRPYYHAVVYECYGLYTRPEAITSRYENDPFHEQTRFLIFLSGHLGGYITLRNSAKRHRITKKTSSWDPPSLSPLSRSLWFT